MIVLEELSTGAQTQTDELFMEEALRAAQRAFEANSKSVTTFDQATQEAINMIH